MGAKVKVWTCLVLFICFSVSVDAQPYVQVLGVAQDGGYPHMGCKKQCCKMAWDKPALRRYVVSLALVDPATKKWWLFEATPDIKEQLQYFSKLTKGAYNYLPDGIFITHAHIGHYTGLMQLGREVMNTKNIPVYAMLRLKAYLEDNGPWGQLVKLNNIALHELRAGAMLYLVKDISVKPFIVPHRDEYSETAGFRINAGKKTYLFIPDINKWSKWDKDIVNEVERSDVALLDATFYSGDELGKIDISEVPHPFVTETMQLFSQADAVTRAKIHFIHMNHTNPLIRGGKAKARCLEQGFKVAVQGERL